MTEYFGPQKYAIIINKDSNIPSEVLEKILMSVYHKTKEESLWLIDSITQQGYAKIADYIFEIADQKCDEMIYLSEINGYTINCTITETTEV